MDYLYVRICERLMSKQLRSGLCRLYWCGNRLGEMSHIYSCGVLTQRTYVPRLAHILCSPQSASHLFLTLSNLTFFSVYCDLGTCEIKLMMDHDYMCIRGLEFYFASI
jgi:hypothetical protein